MCNKIGPLCRRYSSFVSFRMRLVSRTPSSTIGEKNCKKKEVKNLENHSTSQNFACRVYNVTGISTGFVKAELSEEHNMTETSQ